MFGGNHDEWWVMPAVLLIVAGSFLFFDPLGMKKAKIQYFVENTPAVANVPGPVVPPGNTATIYPQPGEVGFKGDPAALVPAGPATGTYTITGSQTLANCKISVPIMWDGQGGKLTITNCVIDVGATTTGAINAQSGGTIEIRTSTIKGVASNSRGAITGPAVKLIYESDISGTGSGIDSISTGSIIQHNWIHDLAQEATCTIKNNGIQVPDGQGNISINMNRIELATVGCNANAEVITQGANIGEVRIDSNFLKGSDATLKNQNGSMGVTNNVFTTNTNINPATKGCCSTKYYSLDGGTGTIFAWVGNIDETGSDVPHP